MAPSVLLGILAASSIPGLAAFLSGTPCLAGLRPCENRLSAVAVSKQTGALDIRCSSERVDRRAFAGLVAAGIGSLVLPGGNSAWASEASMRKLMPSEAELSSYEKGPGGVLFKDITEGVGTAPKDGDKLRMQVTMFLQDGTMVTRRDGVEMKGVLGTRELPAGLMDGMRGMKVGGQRIISLPAEVGFSAEYRTALVAAVKGCSGAACQLDTEPVVAMVKLVGYEKKECQGYTDGISTDTSQLFSKGEVRFTIGSETCPEGNTEITEDRLKTRGMIDKLKAAGKIDTSKQEGFAGVVPSRK